MTIRVENEMTNISITIYGNLKEAGIRFSAMHQAYKLGLSGIARFIKGNAVCIEAEGKTEQLEQLKTWSQEIAEKYGKGTIEFNHKKKLRGYTEFNIID